MSAQAKDLEWELRERQHVQQAIEKSRLDALITAVDEMVSRVMDCEQLIQEGGYTYERAFTSMIRPQAERLIAARLRWARHN